VSAEALAKADSRVGWQAACIKSQRVRCVAKRRRLPGVARRAKTGGANMRYVYLLESIDFPNQSYVGLADDLRARLAAHNSGQSPHTAKFKPWRLVTYVAFSDASKAVAFEKYLKSASGRAFAKKRLK